MTSLQIRDYIMMKVLSITLQTQDSIMIEGLNICLQTQENIIFEGLSINLQTQESIMKERLSISLQPQESIMPSAKVATSTHFVMYCFDLTGNRTPDLQHGTAAFQRFLYLLWVTIIYSVYPFITMHSRVKQANV